MKALVVPLFVAIAVVVGCAKKDEPLSIYDEKHDEPIFMALPQDGAEVVDARRMAKESLPGFRDAILQRKYPHGFFNLKGYFPEHDGSEGAHLWLCVVEIRPDGYLCAPFELPPEFTGLNMGQRVLMTDDMVEDWMILNEGTLFGGFSLRVQRSHVPDAEKAKYDAFIGVTDYSDQKP